jgi:hypothetical protein
MRHYMLFALAIAVASVPSAGAQTRVTNPHGELALECAACHRPDSWTAVSIPKGFRHADGRFALDGAHGRVACTACHASLKFKGASRACASCHADVHRGELGNDCSRCHSTRSFVDRAQLARMHQLTRFPLAGAHLVVDCQQCHTRTAQGQLTFVGRSVACVSCHERDYVSVQDPDHVNGGFPRQCDQCHIAVSWRRARFDHNGTRFPLTGAHARVACAGCHGDKVYKGKSTECVSCHQSDYDKTTDPAHAGAGFPTTCATCHNTTSWNGASFNHDAPYFPIYSGAHAGRWTTCATCHTSPTNYAQFTCFSCHEHDKTLMDSKHQGRSGYVYDSQACYSCHKNGRAG